jgi:predicted alpha-1,2-mannosidase
LKPLHGGVVNVRIGTSFVSIDQARLNLKRELGTVPFDRAVRRTAAVWENMLGRAEITTPDMEQKGTFYSCLYRALLFPRTWHEVDAVGRTFHRSPYDGKLHPGVMFADNGFWDTYRTVYPLYAILFPDQLGTILEGWVNGYRESGWLPKWPSPGERGGMIGSHIDAVIADACVKGIPGFDLAKAYEGMRKHATEVAGDRLGRTGLDAYLRKGFVPEQGNNHGVSCTLDYAYDDFCIAQVAAALGRDDDRRTMLRRAQNYRKLFDPRVGFMRGRTAGGEWVKPFDEFAWGGPYVEGSVWQCGWAVPHDPAGLIKLMGGDKQFVAKLDHMLSQPPRFNVVHYPYEIHEMTEMAAVDFGQYAHSNQPVHHVLYLYAAAGRPDRTQYWVRRVLNELYNSGPAGFAGDEDNGEMSSWYVLSSLGFYPLCPGTTQYVFGSPLFKRVVLHPPSGRDLTITAAGNGPATPYVKAVHINGKPTTHTYLDHRTIAAGGTLKFTMSHKPAWTRVPRAADRPFALSQYGR